MLTCLPCGEHLLEYLTFFQEIVCFTLTKFSQPIFYICFTFQRFQSCLRLFCRPQQSLKQPCTSTSVEKLCKNTALRPVAGHQVIAFLLTALWLWHLRSQSRLTCVLISDKVAWCHHSSATIYMNSATTIKLRKLSFLEAAKLAAQYSAQDLMLLAFSDKCFNIHLIVCSCVRSCRYEN